MKAFCFLLYHVLYFLLVCVPPEVYNTITKEKAMKSFITGGTGFMGKCLPIHQHRQHKYCTCDIDLNPAALIIWKTVDYACSVKGCAAPPCGQLSGYPSIFTLNLSPRYSLADASSLCINSAPSLYRSIFSAFQ